MRPAAKSRLIWPPQPGFFRLRLVNGGWAVPAQICHSVEDGHEVWWLSRDIWWSVIDGIENPPHEDPAQAPGVDQIWHYGQMSTEAEYRALNHLREHAAVDHPARNPRRRIDFATLRPRRLK